MNPIQNKKQAEILKSSRELFWKHGVKRVSVSEVCLKAGVSKMTFYRLYPNKIELAKAVYDEEVRQGLKSFKTLLEEEIPPEDKIRKILMGKLKGTNDISQEFIKDFYESPELGLKEYIEEKTRQIWRETLDDFRKAQADGLFRKDLNLEFFLCLATHLTGMLSDEKLLKLFATPQELVMEIANFCVYGIIPHNSKS